MARKPQPVGEALRARRIEVLKKGLREMARTLEIAPAHLTDLETGRRTPSDDLLVRIAKEYGVAEAELRAGWSRPEAIVDEVASQDPLTAEKVPEFLRRARHLSPEGWDEVIRLATERTKKKG